jgi:small GTP-binding protein
LDELIAEMTQVDYEVILLGDYTVGKTTLFHYLRKDEVVDDVSAMTGVDMTLKSVKIGDKTLTVKINDTGGDERFRTITSNFYRRAQIALLVYSVNDRYTLGNLGEWMRECVNNNFDPDNLMFVLIGNKQDLDNEVEPENVTAFMSSNKITHYYLISALTGSNVKEMFENVIKAAHDSGVKHFTKTPNVAVVTTTTTRSTNNSKKCC